MMSAPLIALTLLLLVSCVVFLVYQDASTGDSVTDGNDGNLHRRWFGGRRAMARVLDRRKHNEHFERKGFDPAAETYAHDVLHDHEDEHEDHEHGDFRYEGMYDAGDSYDGDAEWDQDHYNGDYFDEDFNITERLITLFPSIDSDGNLMVTVEEMEARHYENGLNSSRTRSEQEFNTTDEDGSGTVTLKEYLKEDFFDNLLTPEGMKSKPDPNKHSPEGDDQATDQHAEDGEDTEDNHYTREWARTMARQFSAADADKDGVLNKDEFHNFLNPEDSGDESLMAVLLAEDVSDRDDNRDGALSFEEFEQSLWYALSSGESTEEETGEWNEQKDKQRAEAKFTEIDSDKDGLVTPHELKAVAKQLHPSEADYAKEQAAHMVEQADGDGDGKLTLDEMKENPYVFYSAAFRKDSSYDDTYHDEFR
ncbi:hypothetical protein PPROV_000776500 [Pycnococcus provasolii]|uniref:EF-hand domain-containing protein n=1 Tax=Pycnococcus provasolii TaxID=41880 RepID=A0A830HQ38_9CHLO|nr:hypothetical protein PPROV_000776500 [Pycnococcus provasolii]